MSRVIPRLSKNLFPLPPLCKGRWVAIRRPGGVEGCVSPPAELSGTGNPSPTDNDLGKRERHTGRSLRSVYEKCRERPACRSFAFLALPLGELSAKPTERVKVRLPLHKTSLENTAPAHSKKQTNYIKAIF